MATGASNLSGERIQLFDLFGVPKSSNIKEGYVVAFTSDSGDNKIVDIPTAATALLGGRAFAGVSCDQGTTVAYTSTSPPGDNQIQVAVKGVAKCALKANTACTRGQEAAYDPADGGPVVPYTSSNQVKIGRFTQSKSSSSSEQFVGVELDMGSVWPQGLLGGIVADAAAAATNVATEQTYTDATQTIKANRLTAGTMIDIEGIVVVTNQNGTDTIQLKLYLGSTAILTTVAFDPATGDIIKFRARVKIRTAGASGTFVAMAESNRGADAAVAGAAPVLDMTASTAIDTTASTTVSLTSTWSGASANNVSVVRLFDVHLSAAA